MNEERNPHPKAIQPEEITPGLMFVRRRLRDEMVVGYGMFFGKPQNGIVHVRYLNSDGSGTYRKVQAESLYALGISSSPDGCWSYYCTVDEI